MSTNINSISTILATASVSGDNSLHRKGSWLANASANPPVFEGLPEITVKLNGSEVQLPALVLMSLENAYISSHPATVESVIKLASQGVVNAGQLDSKESGTSSKPEVLPGHTLSYSGFRASFFGQFATKENIAALYEKLDSIDTSASSKVTKAELIALVNGIKLGIISQEGLDKLAELWEKEKISYTLLDSVKHLFKADLFILREKVVSGTLLGKEAARDLKVWSDSHKLAARAKVADVTSKDGGLYLGKKPAADIFSDDEWVGTIGIGSAWEASPELPEDTTEQ